MCLTPSEAARAWFFVCVFVFVCVPRKSHQTNAERGG